MKTAPARSWVGPARWADVTLFARSQWRRSWSTLAVLSLAVAAVTTVVLTAATGARHTPGAFERLRAATDASDVHVALSHQSTPTALQRLEQVDGVAAATAQPLLWIRPVGSDLYPGYHLYSVTDDWQHTRVDRPIVVDGRLPDAPTEIAINQNLADALGVKIGDTIALEALSESQLEELPHNGLTEQAAGAQVAATLVGVVKSPIEFGRFRFALYLGPVSADIPALVAGAELRLTDPGLMDDPEFIAALTAELAALDDGTGPYGRVEDPIAPSLFGANAQSDDALDTIARTLWIVVAISVVAGAISIVQLSVRSGRATMSERTSLSALGWTQRRRTMAVLLTTGPWLAAGVLLALPASVALSPIALVGLAAQIDPTPDARVVDGAVLGVGGAAMLGLMLVLGLTAASVAAGTRARSAVGARAWVSLGHPLLPRVGLRHALEGPAGPGRRSTRAASGLAALTVVGVLAALSVSASIDRLQTDPSLVGADDKRGVGGEELDNLRTNLSILRSDPRVADIEHLAFLFGPAPLDHPDEPLAVIAVDMVQGTVRAKLPKGRVPVQSDEILLGPALLDRFDVDVGDDIVLSTGEVEARYRIVGSALGPEGDFHFDEYATMTFSAMDRLVGSTADNSELGHELSFSYVPGTNETAADNDLRARGLEIFPQEMGVLPPPVANLGQVADIPGWVAAYVGLLGLGALGHGLIVGTSTGRREFTVLRALGLRRRGTIAIVAYQGLAMASLGALVGFPLGLLSSRQLWLRIATDAHVIVETAWPWRTILALGVVWLAATTSIGCIAASRTMYGHRTLPPRTE